MKGWSWDAFAAKWNEGYEQLKAYAQREGHARPPQGFKTSDAYALGSWVDRQRKSKDTLSEERFKLLEALKGWRWDARAEQWNEGYERLKEYAEQVGHARPPQGFKTSDGYALGT